ncbi:phosphoglycerate mutase-like protein [Irpex rosettiformis]|uniref:Phosphoglycerate mutase-like protein n=1 Tax=Irpex rosettiformis TaxID=378272 RepID=A0ACB8TPT9_9APHY|nr:phosphoglycerate mutase-like protein [Irpex rosettiformis]
MHVSALLTLLPFISLAYASPLTERSEAFDVSKHLGNLSPYFSAPAPSGGVQNDLPGDCKVDQVILMHRHGARFPLSSELVFIQNLAAKLVNSTDAIQKAKLPGNLQFLKEGYKSTLGHDNLTAIGRAELFDHGAQFKLKYPDLVPTSVLAGLQDRVIESAQWFANGYFGRDWAALNATMFQTIPEDNVTISWITPMGTCRNWQYAYGNNATIAWGAHYLPPITKRLNKLLPAVNLTTDNVHGALYACAYDGAAYGLDKSPWCSAFTPSEIEDFEYELDLLMDGAFGYNLPGDMGPVLGSVYVNTLLDRLTNETGTAEEVYLEFGHDTTIDLALVGLGLVEDIPGLSTSSRKSGRKFRTSLQVPFGAQMVWERFSCEKTLVGRQVRLVLNDAVVPLVGCASGKEKMYGSCEVGEFVKSQSKARGIKWGDATWNATCGDAGF